MRAVHESGFLGRLGGAAGAVGAALGVAVLGAGPAVADGPVQVKSRLGDVCLDAPTGSWYSALVVNPCNGSDSSAGTSMACSSKAWPSPGAA